MDHRADMIAEFEQVSKEITELGRQKRAAEARKVALEEQLKKSMGKSKIGTVNGVAAIEVYESVRRTISIKTAEKVCPELLNQLITKSESEKIRVLNV